MLNKILSFLKKLYRNILNMFNKLGKYQKIAVGFVTAYFIYNYLIVETFENEENEENEEIEDIVIEKEPATAFTTAAGFLVLKHKNL